MSYYHTRTHVNASLPDDVLQILNGLDLVWNKAFGTSRNRSSIISTAIRNLGAMHGVTTKENTSHG